MDTITMIEVVGVIIAIVAFCAMMYFSKSFRYAVISYVKKRWKENKKWVFALIDEEIDDIAKGLNVEISKKTDKYIRYEVLKRSIEIVMHKDSPYAKDWVKTEYKAILEQLLGDNQ